MVSPLPLSIESYLVEAGLTPVELLIIKRLLDEDALTVREIASKSGKSIGSVDQALKRLLQKNIVRKAMLNEQPRYFISSIDSMMKWIEKERMEKKKEEHKRDADFARYLAQIKEEKGKPELEYYSTMEGIHMAYTRLLETGSEILTYTTITPESVLMTPFGHSFTEQRRFKKVMQRFIVPDTCEARKFQSRDYLEFRKTILIPPHEFQYESEESISGDYVLSVNSEKSEATFAKHSKLAQGLRSAFEALWAKQHAQDQVPTTVVIPLQQRLRQALREFFWSRRSVVIFSIFAVISLILTAYLWSINREVNLKQLQEKVLAIASTGALQFDVNDIEKIWTKEDINKPEYARLIAKLNLIKRSNSDTKYAYIMRKTDDDTKMAFVADAESLYPNQKKDFNGDGVIDDADALVYPGELYDDTVLPKIQDAYNAPFTNIGTDQWGTFISAHAPIRSSNGKAVAVLGIDVDIKTLDALSAKTFTPLYFVLLFFFILVLVRFILSNQLLIHEILTTCVHRKKILAGFVSVLILFISSYLVMSHNNRQKLMIEQTGKRLQAIATLAALDVNPDDLAQLHVKEDMKKVAYQRVFKLLNDIRERNPEIVYAYIYRTLEMPNKYEFIADADSNWNLPAYMKKDIFDLKPYSSENENVWPGFIYDDSRFHTVTEALKERTYGRTSDQWGNFLSGFAPVYDFHGNIVGILGLDLPLENISKFQ